MEGWELDGSIYPVAREHMGLQQLEDSGALVSLPTCKAQRCYTYISLIGWVCQALHHHAAAARKVYVEHLHPYLRCTLVMNSQCSRALRATELHSA